MVSLTRKVRIRRPRDVDEYKPSRFMEPHRFRTRLDSPEGSLKRYRLGFLIGTEFGRLIITASSSWIADRLPGFPARHDRFFSKDRLGSCPDSEAFIRGVLDSGAEIVVVRQPEHGNLSRTVIRPLTPVSFDELCAA